MQKLHNSLLIYKINQTVANVNHLLKKLVNLICYAFSWEFTKLTNKQLTNYQY